jgi:hypothetical protein
MSDIEAMVQAITEIGRYCSGLTMHSVPLELIPRGPAIAICDRSTSCTAGGSWPHASMRNVHAYRPAFTCSISVAASGGASRYLTTECGCRVGAIDFYGDILGMPLVHAMKVPPTSTTNNRASIIA